MKVKDAIKELLKYNQDADLSVVANNTPYDFSFAYGSSEGVTKKNCDSVSLYIEKANTNDKSRS